MVKTLPFLIVKFFFYVYVKYIYLSPVVSSSTKLFFRAVAFWQDIRNRRNTSFVLVSLFFIKPMIAKEISEFLMVTGIWLERPRLDQQCILVLGDQGGFGKWECI